MDSLTVTSYAEGSWTVADVAGEVDPATAPRLREALLELVAAGHVHLVVDLDAV